MYSGFYLYFLILAHKVMVERSENVDSEENQLMTAGTEIQPEPQKPTVQVRKARKKKSSNARKEYTVQVIPATKGVTPAGEPDPIKRVAAYCRVSTDQEAQPSSYELQVQH